MGTMRAAMQRLLDLSLVALAVGAGTVGYYWNAHEYDDTRRQHIRDVEALAQRRRFERGLSQRSKYYDRKIKEFANKRDELLKYRADVEAFSNKLSRHSKEIEHDIKNIRRKLVGNREELEQLASHIDLQKRTLDAEVKELTKLLKMKENLKERTSHEMSRTEAQRRSKVLQAELEELERLVKMKVELQSRAETCNNGPYFSNQSGPTIQKDDPAQS